MQILYLMQNKIIYTPVKRYFLEMNSPPEIQDIIFPENMEVQKFSGTIQEYRNINKSVGEMYGWVDRQIMDEAELSKIIYSPETDIYLLCQNHEILGFAELDLSHPKEISLIYFGLIPEATGKGLGKLFLKYIIDKAWSFHPEKFKLNTSALDHPAALKNYLKAGFILVEEKNIPQACIVNSEFEI